MEQAAGLLLLRWWISQPPELWSAANRLPIGTVLSWCSTSYDKNRGNIMKAVSALIALLLITMASPAVAQHHDDENASTSIAAKLANATVLIIRHAEKTPSGPGLSPAGEERAKAYAGYFQRLTVDGAPVRIDTLIATADSDESRRERLTLEPLSRVTGLPIQQPFDDGAVKDLVGWLAHGPPDRNILIAWHHGKVPMLLADLGLDPSTILPGGRWPSDVYNWLVMLRFDRNGAIVPSRCRLVREPSPLH
jgi:hypothetical protein